MSIHKKAIIPTVFSQMHQSEIHRIATIHFHCEVVFMEGVDKELCSTGKGYRRKSIHDL